jgi:cobaltochelatase CobN
MHLLLRDTRSLDDDAPAQELGQTPAPLVILSFSDADLGALAGAWTPAHPPQRLAPLGRLRHPMSVDLYVEQVAAHARCIVVRLLGGLDYWRYGADELATLARSRGIALAFLPGDAADDTRLRTLSTIPAPAWSALDAAMRAGGPAGNALALAWMAHLAGLAPQPTARATPVPDHGVHTLDLIAPRQPDAPFAAIVFYRSHLMSNDIAPIEALTASLRARGFAVGTLYATSLKAPETAAYIARTLAAWRPTIILNATAFSSRLDTGQDTSPSPLDAPGVPVLQLVLSGSTREAWAASTRGLSPTDLAMHVVLPELDGRLLTASISFKAETTPDPDLQYARTLHRPDADGIALAADRAAGWARLTTTPPPGRRLAIILSDYPGIDGQQGHAVGLDTFASASAILVLLHGAAYTVPVVDTPAITHALCAAPPTPFLSLAEYERLLHTLPAALRAALHDAWGDPAHDPAIIGTHFTLRHLHAGAVTIALQPDRGAAAERKAGYHDPDQPPRHAYVAFYLWLRHGLDIHAMVHLGTHGSLEWLPGKAAALSSTCWPAALAAGLPVIYPFIVNNPGEAAPAKRRLGAVTIGHLTPPIARTDAHGPARALERLIDEYASADGLDRRRATLLRQSILDLAETTGLLHEAGSPRTADPDEALARLDAYLCDVKDLQLRHGLHVYGLGSGQNPHPHASSLINERAALLAALDGRHIPPGPAGAPTRGRTDVLPTGRNLTTTDPRTVPTRAALTLAAAAAEALLRRHLSEHGDYPRAIVLDLWGSATMRTGGEDLALAFVLLGARPLWDDGSARVSGFEILPIALLDRPRIDVTLRISGLFRDAFATQIALFDSLVHAIAARDEAPDWNPLAAAPGPRIYGPAPGQYGAGDATAAAYTEASSTSYGLRNDGTPDAPGLIARLAATDAFIHTQDHAEHDLLDSPEWAVHEGGFHLAAAAAGAAPALYHLDTSTPGTPKPRTVAEEVRRIVRARAANPTWIAAMMHHARAGAAEIARPLAALETYARTLPTRFDAQFDLLHDATLANPEVDAFLRAHNPEAHAGMQARFDTAQRDGLWHPKRNIQPGSTP